MKRTHFLMAMILGIIAITSCQKDDNNEPKGKEMLYGEKLDSSMRTTNNNLAYKVVAAVGDTIWWLDEFGNPIRRRDPETGQWDFQDIKKVEVTVNDVLKSCSFESSAALEREKIKTIDFFNNNANELIYLAFPKGTRIINRTTKDGEVFQDKMLRLDEVRRLLVENPSQTVSQVISSIHKDALACWLKACAEDLTDRILDPRKKALIKAHVAKTDFQMMAVEIMNK